MYALLLALMLMPASGTSRNPESAPMEMIHLTRGDWMLMLHGQAFLIRANDSGPRGNEKTFSTNWFMASGTRRLGAGDLTLRTMLSLEPATISARKYPELFQTGETAFGKQLIDAQHPHDFFMELAADYRYRNAYLYVAPVGEPALGPVAFMHRDSAMELPQSPIGHHYEDSTHIAFNVVTAGFDAGKATVEASAFHGGEPDERRWDIDGGRIDSWSARVRLRPTANLDLQISHGRLAKPERIEPGYATRTTASASYNLPLPFGRWTSTICWGQVYKEVHDRTLNAWLGESALHLGQRNHFVMRAERVDKDEIFPHPILTKVPRPPLPVRVFRIEAFTYGYTVDVARGIGVGANVTTYRFPSLLQGFYSPHPHAVLFFTRARLGG